VSANAKPHRTLTASVEELKNELVEDSAQNMEQKIKRNAW